MGAAIWQNDGGTWALASPDTYTDEAALHDRVEEAPQILPLAGDPTLAIAGREVYIGGGKADLIAVETSGRLVVIEVKLARNPEARRAVVAQILTYAAFLRGLSVQDLESQVLAEHLSKRGHATLADLVQAGDQTGSFEAEAFDDALRQSLAEGRFRLVLVLDSVPAELVRLTGYLALIADRVTIDLITVSSYNINGAQVLVPQRVDPEHLVSAVPGSTPRAATNPPPLLEGADAFKSAIERAKPEQQPLLRKLVGWAEELQSAGLARLYAVEGKTRVTLLPRIPGDFGLATVVCDSNGAALWLFRGVFERRAPQSISIVEHLLTEPLKQGNSIRDPGDALLQAVTDAYREASPSAVAPAENLPK
ncbi:MAG TPA: hypothetical protein VFC53_04045 [Dehalococcoidia bacterium]|nr:hypothetical protein [Dehalococcoidia bacterium]